MVPVAVVVTEVPAVVVVVVTEVVVATTKVVTKYSFVLDSSKKIGVSISHLIQSLLLSPPPLLFPTPL